MTGDIMFRGKRHGFFCRCEICKSKRRHSLIYLICLLLLILIIYYQSFLLIFITTQTNAILLFVELVLFGLGVFRIFF